MLYHNNCSKEQERDDKKMSVTKLKLNLNELKAERIRRGLSQEKLAEKLGQRANWVCRRESGITEITIPEFYQIAQAMGCTKAETNTLLRKITGE